MYTIYQALNTVNKKSYIGFTTETPSERWTKHKSSARRGSRTHFHCSIRKNGPETFSLTVIEEGMDDDYGLCVREPYWISVLKPEYNRTAGGEGTLGNKPSKEQSQAQSVFMTGNKLAMGYRWSEKQKASLAAGKVGKKRGPYIKRGIYVKKNRN